GDSNQLKKTAQPIMNVEGFRLEPLCSNSSDEPDRAVAKAAPFRAGLVVLEMKIAAVELVEAWHKWRLESEAVAGRAILIGIDRDDERLVQCWGASSWLRNEGGAKGRGQVGRLWLLSSIHRQGRCHLPHLTPMATSQPLGRLVLLRC